MTEPPVLDWGALADPDYVGAMYQERQLRDAAAYGLGVAKLDEGPTGELADEAAVLASDLRQYMDQAWHVLEPKAAYVPNWHLDAIADHLMAVTRGDIKDLVINMPPRCTKSMSVSVLWMTWEWTHMPWTQWLFSSYVDTLSIRDSLKCRRLIRSTWYQERWGHTFQLAGDQNLKGRFDNNRSGYRIATSVGGSATGEGGNRLVLDDPHDPKGTESEARRPKDLEWWDLTWSTRRNDPINDARVVMMQRLHQKDMTGHILDELAEPFEHLVLPMRYDPERRCVTVLGEPDPRTEPGELLCPERFPEYITAAMEKTLGPYGTAGQFQQQPTARSGGQFERAWFLTDYDRVPKGSRMIWVRAWDPAGSEGTGAYTCGLLMGLRVTDGLIFVKHVVRGQWRAGARNATVKATAENDAQSFQANGHPNKLAVLQLFEQEGGSGGKDQAAGFRRLLRGYRVEAMTATGDKFTRADPFAGACKNGDVHVLPGPWREQYLDEMEAAGPGAAYLDQMDASSAGYNRLMALWDRHKQGSGQGIDMDLLEDDDMLREPGWKVS